MHLYSDEDLISSIKELKIIDDLVLEDVIKTSQIKKEKIEKILVEKDILTENNLGKIISEIIKIPFVDLSTVSISKDVLMEVPEVVAEKQKIIAFKKDSKGLHLAMLDPSNFEIVEFVERKTGLPVIVYLAAENDLYRALSLYTANVEEAFADIIKKNIEQVKNATVDLSIEPPIIKIVETILSYGYKNRASDIHIEPQDKDLLVRFRIDGVLHDIISLPLQIHEQIVSRIKVLAKLRTDEHQSAQDGKIQFETNEELLDIRVSIVPIVKGEKIVMRLLSEKSRQFSLLSLGFGEDDMRKVKEAYQKPYGMILSTGPTGSGKTTSMYAILKLLNNRDINIMTIEDPVEYNIEGINQIQVNTKTKLTFAKGLRSILRQDPNVILVGEIRDSETASIAVNAAMTGHLVLSTLHTNDAATAVPRLLDQGIEPFLIATTVNIIIAQRLVRKICINCRYSLETDRSELEKFFSEKLLSKTFGSDKKIRLYKGKGCPVCHNTGYQDRMGIFETMVIDEKLRDAIVARKDSETIKKIAMENGMRTMIEDGLEKIKRGDTTVEEVLRVSEEQL
jgi:type IV pilus assembly protein PilB